MFSVAAVAHCTSMVKSSTETYYKLDATIGKNGEICRVVGQSNVESQEYTVSAELLNQAGWQGINSGHPGVLFNAVDENNFDFVYFRWVTGKAGCWSEESKEVKIKNDFWGFHKWMNELSIKLK